jgi:putative oxidoreductase
MNPIRSLGRTLLASMFVMEGADTLANASSKVSAYQDMREPLAETVPAASQWDTETVVRATGAAQVVGGLMLALGKLPRLSSTVLAASLLPQTLAEHRFWEESDEAKRTDQQVHFGKNVGLLGGLLIAAMDTAGRPSVAWRAGHATEHAEIAARHTGREARMAAKLAKAEAKRAKAEATRGLAKTSAKAATEAKRVRAEAGRGVERTKRALTPDVFDLARVFRSDDDE